MRPVDLRATDATASGGPDWKTRALSVAIALLLLAGVGVAAVRTGSDSGSSVATAEDLQLLQSSSVAVDGLEAIQMSMRFEINGQTITMEGTGSGTNGRFTLSGPGFDDVELIQIENRSYVPAIGQPGWSEFIAPAGTEVEPSDAIAGQDPLDHLRSISSAEEIEILGPGTVEGVEVTRYRAEIALADALRAAEANLGDLGISDADREAVLSAASPMRIDIEIDDAGIPRRTRVTYEIQGIDFEIESRVRPVEAVDTVEPPPESEIVSSHTATDAAHFQQLIGSHIAQLAGD